jgi:AcrR family transcriptional regulator
VREKSSTVRVDGRRNYGRLLASAREAFDEQGTEVSLREVARRAGVGIGTLYRHFPSRDALLEALLSDQFEEMRNEAGRLQRDLPAGEALTTWLRSIARGSARVRGLPESVLASLRDKDSQLHAACDAMRTAGAELLSAAQHSGVARADVTASDLYVLVNGIAWVAAQVPTEPELGDRLLSVALRGIWATPDG